MTHQFSEKKKPRAGGRLFLLSLFFLILVSCAAAQDDTEYEYGSMSELKGLTKVYIDTGPDVESFDQIKAELSKVPTLRIVTDGDEAEFAIEFVGDKAAIGVPGQLLSIGAAIVSMPAKKGKGMRILMNYKGAQNGGWGKKPATKFAREFVKKYKEANGLK